MTNKNPNTEGILKYAKSKKERTKKHVLNTITVMVKANKVINFNSVAKETGVSKAYLYKNIELKENIEELRAKDLGRNTAMVSKRNVSDKSKDVLIEALKNKITKLNSQNSSLEKENSLLKEKIKKMLGDVYEKI